MDKLTQPALVALGGALGSLARFGLAQVLPGLAQGFPWATFVANVVGCFVAGAVFQMYPGSDFLRHLAIIGFCGGFTTFSAFSLEAIMLFERSPAVASGYFLASFVCGIAGILLARLIF